MLQWWQRVTDGARVGPGFPLCSVPRTLSPRGPPLLLLKQGVPIPLPPVLVPLPTSPLASGVLVVSGVLQLGVPCRRGEWTPPMLPRSLLGASVTWALLS